MPRPKRMKKTQEEIARKNQINALRQRLATERYKRQNQSTIKKTSKRNTLKNDYRDAISAEMPGIIESGEPIYEEISDKQKIFFIMLS